MQQEILLREIPAQQCIKVHGPQVSLSAQTREYYTCSEPKLEITNLKGTIVHRKSTKCSCFGCISGHMMASPE